MDYERREREAAKDYFILAIDPSVCMEVCVVM